MITDEQLRHIGFSTEARNHPRPTLALRALAAFNNVRPAQLGPASAFFPNSWTAKTWGRVVNEVLEAAAQMASDSHLVPPDGGSPTDDEIEVAKRAAERIRSMKIQKTV